MFEYKLEKELVVYLIKNQHKYFKEKFDCEIISGNTIFSVYFSKEEGEKSGECDMVGLSDDTIYIIEVKRDVIGKNTIRDYGVKSKYLIWSLKKINYLFIAPRISEQAKTEMEKYDNFQFYQINDVKFNNEIQAKKIDFSPATYRSNGFEYEVIWFLNRRLRTFIKYINKLEYITEGVHTRSLLEGKCAEINFKFDKGKYGIRFRIYRRYYNNSERYCLEYLSQIIKYYKKSDKYKIIIPYIRKYDSPSCTCNRNIRYVFEQVYKINTHLDEEFNDRDITTIVKIADCIHSRNFNEKYKGFIL